MKFAPLVSIIINCHNGERYLSDALNSILLQKYENLEIIFYDNNSDDNSAKIVKEKITNLKYYKTNTTENLGTARKNALNLTNGKYIAFLDCDDIWEPEHLKLAISYLEQNTEYNLTYNNISLINYKGDIIKKKLFNKIKPSGKIFRQLLSGYFLTIATVVIRSSFLKKNNLNFDVRFNLINDVDLFTRISFLTNIKYLNRITAQVRIHELRLTNKNFFSFYKEHQVYLNQLKSQIKNFEIIYQKEISYLRNILNYQEALLDWKLKKYVISRRKLLKCSKMNFKYLIVFFLTYFIEYKNFKKIFIKNL